MNTFYWDSFDCQIQCEEFMDYIHRKPDPKKDLDWIDAHMEVFEIETPFISEV